MHQLDNRDRPCYIIPHLAAAAKLRVCGRKSIESFLLGRCLLGYWQETAEQNGPPSALLHTERDARSGLHGSDPFNVSAGDDDSPSRPCRSRLVWVWRRACYCCHQHCHQQPGGTPRGGHPLQASSLLVLPL